MEGILLLPSRNSPLEHASAVLLQEVLVVRADLVDVRLDCALAIEVALLEPPQPVAEPDVLKSRRSRRVSEWYAFFFVVWGGGALSLFKEEDERERREVMEEEEKGNSTVKSKSSRKTTKRKEKEKKKIGSNKDQFHS